MDPAGQIVLTLLGIFALVSILGYYARKQISNFVQSIVANKRAQQEASAA
jgi:LPXTG-motif cell wall-anchored protein